MSKPESTHWGVLLPKPLVKALNAECDRQGRTRQFVTERLFANWLDLPADEREAELSSNGEAKR